MIFFRENSTVCGIAILNNTSTLVSFSKLRTWIIWITHTIFSSHEIGQLHCSKNGWVWPCIVLKWLSLALYCSKNCWVWSLYCSNPTKFSVCNSGNYQNSRKEFWKNSNVSIYAYLILHWTYSHVFRVFHICTHKF